jgi:putative transposase
MSKHFEAPLEEGCYYHIFNRGNNGNNLFYQSKNYIYFLRKYDAYLSDYVETYSYCLMPNHFHLLIRVKDRQEFKIKEKEFPKAVDMERFTTEEMISELFRRFFMSYSKAINIQEGRTGSLFQKIFRRRKVDRDRYFIRLVHYIHHQPEHHGFKKWDYESYPWSSYRRVLIDAKTSLMKAELLDWFGSKEEFMKFHEQSFDKNVIEHLIADAD